ncbi:choice-of-anchor M domain-containing protein [Streptomyces sp. NRRL WC-3549]|uniref:choice-of-anchor M domain-containing protein n=1 Tax=Streptomyces sp. NRRL WC-3549 TaxID=1463925 RepID=UPI0004C7A23C|nr:choice-of-anchor M domain-containing protein [Streptomyces sp. NRRL WC-3549]
MSIGAAGLVAGGSGTARAAGGPVVIEDGEMDLVPRLVDGALRLQLDDRSGGVPVVREPSQVVVHAGPATKEEVISPAYPIVGELVDAYFLNGYANAGQIYAPEPGWRGDEAGGDTEVRLTGFEGLGLYALYTYTPAMDSADEPAVQHLGSDSPAPGSFTLPADEERLAPTWAFTREGVYRLTFTVTGEGRTDTGTLAVVVGDDVDPADVVPGDGQVPSGPPTTPTAGPAPTPAATRPAAHVIGNGHLDLAARPADEGLSFQIKEGTSQVYAWYEPGDVVLHVKPAAKRKIGEGYEFLGEAGDAMWLLPMRQIDGLVWPGWSTEEFAAADVRGDVSFRLDSVQGPGSVAVFSTGATGGVDIGLDSRDGLPDELRHSAHAHSHWNWTFTAEGVYRTRFTVSATLSDGRTVSDTETLAWVVGNGTDPSTVIPGDGDAPSPAPTAPSPSATATASAPVPSARPTPSASESGPPTRPDGAGEEVASPATGTGAGPSAGGDAGSGSGKGSPTAAGGLASTGSGAMVIAGGALVALLAGSGAVAVTRRRRTAG